MNFNRIISILFGVSMFFISDAVSAFGNNANDARQCRYDLWFGKFSSIEGQIQLAKVIAKPRSYFLADAETLEGCPENGLKCRSKSIVNHGSEVLIFKTKPGFVCAIYPTKSGRATGWLPDTQIAINKDFSLLKPTLEAWKGHWYSGDNQIKLAISDNALKASGNAYWPKKGLETSQDGEFTGEAVPVANHLVLATDADYGGNEEPCKLNMNLVGNFLVVTDNSNCGGRNVRFDGIYKRGR